MASNKTHATTCTSKSAVEESAVEDAKTCIKFLGKQHVQYLVQRMNLSIVIVGVEFLDELIMVNHSYCISCFIVTCPYINICITSTTLENYQQYLAFNVILYMNVLLLKTNMLSFQNKV